MATLVEVPQQVAKARPAINPWVIALTVTMATFMELLDTSIANVSLPYIGGGLGRSYDEVTWVLTTYLVANAVILPMSAWLSRAFGRKTYYLACVALFTLMSLFCGLAPSLGIMLMCRVLQGIAGGGLAPVAQAILVWIRFLLRSGLRRLRFTPVVLVTAPCDWASAWRLDLRTTTAGAGYFCRSNVPVGLLWRFILSSRLVE